MEQVNTVHIATGYGNLTVSDHKRMTVYTVIGRGIDVDLTIVKAQLAQGKNTVIIGILLDFQ